MSKRFFCRFFAVLFSISCLTSPIHAPSLFAQAAGITFAAPSGGDQAYLTSVYADTWKYLADFVEPTTGIPYDSSRMQPATSLSNVGLYLAVVSIAAQTGLIDRAEALNRVNMAFTSLDKVEKWQGIPRVWFSARTLIPTAGTEMFSYSKHVSNLIAGLVIAKVTFPELVEPMDRFLNGMNLKSMYEAKNGWLKGGYNVSTRSFAVGQPFGNWYYKFFASEARLVSFYAVASGAAPESHWGALTRPVQKEGDYWFYEYAYEDGGAYMPYMASLYIDERPTLMGTAQQNYSLAQMARAERIGAPVWGWSASFDTKSVYIPYGELKDEIVTPYASMLAMLHFPEKGAANLRKLEELGGRPQVMEEEKKSVYAAYELGGENGKLWAVLYGGDVFFLDASGVLKRFSSYMTWPERFTENKGSDRDALQKLSTPLGYKLEKNQTISVHLKNTMGPAGLNREALRSAVGSEDKYRDLMTLAALTGLYSPGQVAFRDGRISQAAWIKDAEGSWKPWALRTEKEVFFLNQAGEAVKFSEFLEGSAGKKLESTEDDRLICRRLSEEMYRPEEWKQPTEACLERKVGGTALKAELAAAIPPGASVEDLLGLAAQAGLYSPGQVTLKAQKQGNFGFRDAVNWKNGEVAKDYLTPSQAMGFLALANVLYDGVVWKTFGQDPVVQKGLTVLKPAAEEALLYGQGGDSCFCGIPRSEKPLTPAV